MHLPRCFIRVNPVYGFINKIAGFTVIIIPIIHINGWKWPLMYKTLVIVDNASDLASDQLDIISFEAYLTDYPKLDEPKTRVINLCDTDRYLSKGYYCSLLAEARQHKVLPNMSTINDLRVETSQSNFSWFALGNLVTLDIGQTVDVPVFLGWSEDAAYRKLARQAFEKFAAPLLKLTIKRDANGLGLQVQRMAFQQLSDAQKSLLLARLTSFTSDVWKTFQKNKNFRWNLAILVNPDESYPPSDNEAIKRFVKAAGKVNIFAQIIHPDQAHQISQFDALFIRETTAIDHHTYRIARQAEKDGLVVIDDCTSILRCCNKVFLHDAFTYNKVPSPKTLIVHQCDDAQLDKLESEFDYPIVLKMPEGAFSRGVFKVKNRDELAAKMTELFAESALILVQEYMYTDFDWRIGVLNGRAIYACRYKMARNHWQIYNHGAAKSSTSGGFDTMPTFEVPKKVLDAALKACAIIGKGLYGVDIKQKGNQAYVIEVNDNPSIDYRVEDKYLGNELYMVIMNEFAQRLELRGKLIAK